MPSAPDLVKAQAVAESMANAQALLSKHEPFRRAVSHLNAQTERPVAQQQPKDLGWDPLEN